MKISQSTIHAVQNMMRIEEVVADFVSLHKKGQSLWACCPFHHENTPSFTVSPVRGFYKCFGCDASGDAITFIQEIEGVTFVEAIHQLAKKYGIAVEWLNEGDEATVLQDGLTKESLYILLNAATNYYSNLLWNHAEAVGDALPYLERRAIPTLVSKKFTLGYSLKRWDAFYAFATEQGFSLELLLAAGLVVQQGNKVYDRFRGRLMFPIHNSVGQVVAFGARHLCTEAAGPKYLNSPETLIYHKGALLYGFSLARQAIKQAQNCYLVEGYTDVLAFHMAGLANVVAASGTALTEEQLHNLCRFTNKVTLVFDGDQAGLRAALRGIDKLLEKGLEVKVLPLPGGEDPDSYFRAVGKAAFCKYVADALQDFVTFKAGLLFSEAKRQSPAEAAACIKDIVQSIALIPDAITGHLLLKKCSEMFLLSENLLSSTYESLRHKASTSLGKRRSMTVLKKRDASPTHVGGKELPFANKITMSIEAYEREVVRILLRYGAVNVTENQRLSDYIFLEVGNMKFKSSACQLLFDYCKHIYQQEGIVDMQACLIASEEKIKKMAIDLTAERYELSEVWEKKYAIYTVSEAQQLSRLSFEIIMRLKMRLVQELIEENREALKAVLSIEEEEALLKVHQALKSAEAGMAKKLGVVVLQ